MKEEYFLHCWFESLSHLDFRVVSGGKLFSAFKGVASMTEKRDVMSVVATTHNRGFFIITILHVHTISF